MVPTTRLNVTTSATWDPGEFYTRRHPQMYRPHVDAAPTSLATARRRDTRDGIEKTLAAGGTGVNVVVDTLTQQALDPDHPAFGAEASWS